MKDNETSCISNHAELKKKYTKKKEKMTAENKRPLTDPNSGFGINSTPPLDPFKKMHANVQNNQMG